MRVKARVKSAVSFVDKYEELLQDLARHRKCDGIICGHIHTPEDKQVGGIHYLNSGDWVESLTAIIEHDDGRMELVQYEKFLNSLNQTETHPPASRRSRGQSGSDLTESPADAGWVQVVGNNNS
jgi:hypothetical protein